MVYVQGTDESAKFPFREPPLISRHQGINLNAHLAQHESRRGPEPEYDREIGRNCHLLWTESHAEQTLTKPGAAPLGTVSDRGMEPHL